MLLEEPEEDILESLNCLEKYNVIKKISDKEYLFISGIESSKKRSVTSSALDTFEKNLPNIMFKPTQIKHLLTNLDYYKRINMKNVFLSNEDYNAFFRYSNFVKKRVIKLLILFKVIGNPTLKEIERQIKKISTYNPDYKLATLYYRNKYNCFKRDGLQRLFNGRYGPINKDIYEDFKQLFLSSTKYSQKEAYQIIQEKYKNQKIPLLKTLRNRLNNELPLSKMKRMRHEYKSKKISHKKKFNCENLNCIKINAAPLWINVKNLAKIKNITPRSLRYLLNDDKYECIKIKYENGFSYLINFKSLEIDLQKKYIELYSENFNNMANTHETNLKEKNNEKTFS